MNTRIDWQALNGKLDGIVVENENSWLCCPFGPLPRRASLALKLIERLWTVQQVNNIMTLLSQLDSLINVINHGFHMIVMHTSGWILIGDIFKTKRQLITLRKCGGFKLNDQHPGTAYWLTAFSWKPNQCVDRDPSRDRFVYSTWSIFLSNEHAMFGWNGSYWVG